MTQAKNPFRYFDFSLEVIRLIVKMYVRYPLCLHNFEDLLAQRGIDICHGHCQAKSKAILGETLGLQTSEICLNRFPQPLLMVRKLPEKRSKPFALTVPAPCHKLISDAGSCSCLYHPRRRKCGT